MHVCVKDTHHMLRAPFVLGGDGKGQGGSLEPSLHPSPSQGNMENARASPSCCCSRSASLLHFYSRATFEGLLKVHGKKCQFSANRIFHAYFCFILLPNAHHSFIFFTNLSLILCAFFRVFGNLGQFGSFFLKKLYFRDCKEARKEVLWVLKTHIWTSFYLLTAFISFQYYS